MGPQATLQVPERYADRFRAEAEQVLGSIAASIKDTTDKVEKARGELRPLDGLGVDDDDLAILDGARSVFVQSREQNGTMAVEAPSYTLREVGCGCATESGEELYHRLSSFDFHPDDLLMEIEHWSGAVLYLTDVHEGVLPGNLAKRIQRLAEQKDRSVQAEIRCALREHVGRESERSAG
jgi:hypothetical protein